MALGGVLLFLGLVCIVAYRSAPSRSSVEIIDSFSPDDSVPIQQNGSVTIEVSGAVFKPGVYLLPLGSRIGDAITKAGGLREDADQEFVSRSINKAAKLVDAQKIYIPEKGDPSPILGSTPNMVNINSATQSQLESLDGIGPVTADKIINGRPYSTIEELKSKKIISGNVYEKIKDSIGVY